MPDIGIITEAPAWFILLCIAGGSVYSLILYYKEKGSELSPGLRIGLGILRFLSISIIAFLLLSPFIRSTVEEREKPLVILAMDNSHSVVLSPDSTYLENEFPSLMDDVAGDLDERYTVERYLFGETMEQVGPDARFEGTADFSARQTDMSAVFSHIQDLYSNRNLGAIVIASDGIYNRGINPVYEMREVDVPVYSIAMGDTSVRKDVLISEVRYNRLAFLENDFPVQVIVNAFMLDGRDVEVNIYREGQREASETITISGNSFSVPVNFLLTAKMTGLQRYRISVTSFDGENNTVNNSRDIFIDVLDSRNRILVLSKSPHPDISAIKEALRSNVNYEVDNALVNEFNGSFEPYNLVVLHQVPYRGFSGAELRNELLEKKIPYLMIAGSQTDFLAWNTWQNGLELQVTPGSFEEATPVINNDFSLFTLSDVTADILGFIPPLTAPFGNYLASNAVSTLLFQKIGSVRTSRPLIAFASDGAFRWGYVLGDGIWKWRLSNYARTQDHEAFNELIQKMAQFLSIREERGRFRIFHDSRFLENESIRFEAEVYNDSYELITDPEVSIVISDEEGNEYPFVFSKTSRGYVLNAGSLPPGRYRYKASAKSGGENMGSAGEFFVEPVDAESLVTVADHDLLGTISDRSGGVMVNAADASEVTNILNDREDIKPVIYEQKRFRELISLTVLLLLILTLLSTEWFLRKRAGTY